MKGRTSINLVVLMLCGCPTDWSKPIESLRQALTNARSGQILKQVHPDYSDALGERAALKKDLDWWEKIFDKREIAFEKLETKRSGSSGGTTVIQGQLRMRLDGDTRWSFHGPLHVEFVHGIKPQIRSGILTNFRDIYGLMQQRREAIEANDGAAYAKLLHPNYRSGDENRHEAQSRVAQLLKGARLRINADHYEVEVRRTIVHINEWTAPVTPSVTSTQSPIKSTPSVKNQLSLRKSAGRWRISAAPGRF